MGSGAGHRRPAVRIAAPTGRVRRRGCALRCWTAPRCPAEEECALRSVGAHAGMVPRARRGGAAPRHAWWTRVNDRSGRGPRGAGPGPGPAPPVAATPGATDALVDDVRRPGRGPVPSGPGRRGQPVERWRNGAHATRASGTSIPGPGRRSAMASTEQEEFPDDGRSLLPRRSTVASDTPAPTRSARRVLCVGPPIDAATPPRSCSTRDAELPTRVHDCTAPAPCSRSARDSRRRTRAHDAMQLRIALALAA